MSVKFWLRSFLVVSLLAFLGIVVAVWLSRIEMTANGVHTRLLIPLGSKASLGLPMYAGTADRPVLEQFLDGPVVRVSGDGTWSATWFCEDKVSSRRGSAAMLVIDCAGKKTTYPMRIAPVAKPEMAATPDKLAVISDIEGNAEFLDSALLKLGVTGADGRWAYGPNHLVIAGDAVDRGRDVFAVLWRLYDLSIEAGKAGGAVHLVLGNHEQYMLMGNLSRAHREHIFALEKMGGQRHAFAPDTLLGAWLRQQPVIIQAGSILVTHGGISPQVATNRLTAAQLNAASQRYWRGEATSVVEREAVLGQAGLSQYRGYFQDVDGAYRRATATEVEQVLQRFHANVIVVGHTLVDRITPLYGGRVQAVNVNSNTADQQLLVFENGLARVVELGIGRHLPDERSSRQSRRLDLASAADWAILGRYLQRSYELSRLPYPY